ncbi:hypothetical protein ACOCJ7_03550 [Knoellia sp. CPCC 206453]|uniref:hypothetical protein n=1 Tax=Knoellia pratensis TaxID=3404796 RepID=UPI003620E4EB
MSDTPDEPGTPESPKTPPVTPTQQWAAPVPPAARRSIWGEAMSTTGGKLAVIVAGASLGLVALLTVGLVVGAFARHLGADHRGPWAGDSRQMPMPDQMGPGQRGPQELPRDQAPRQAPPGAGDLPNLGLPGVGGSLHGEAVVPGNGTATRTIIFQTGEVTNVTADRLTVKSTDGFTATYTIGADSRDRLKNKVSTLAKGDVVTVMAAKDSKETLRILRTGRTGAGS